MPGVQSADLRRSHRQPEMEDPVIGHRSGHQDRANRRPRNEALARMYAPAAFDPFGTPRSAHPVAPARGQKHDVLFGDSLQHRFDLGRGCRLMAPAPGRDNHLMGMHCKGQRRRAAPVRQPAHDIGHFANVRAFALQFAGNRRPDQPRRLQALIILGNKALLLIMLAGAGREIGSQPVCPMGKCFLPGCLDILLQGRSSHSLAPWFAVVMGNYPPPPALLSSSRTVSRLCPSPLRCYAFPKRRSR